MRVLFDVAVKLAGAAMGLYLFMLILMFVLAGAIGQALLLTGTAALASILFRKGSSLLEKALFGEGDRHA